MGQWKFHTPNGVADLLPSGCRGKRQIEQSIRRMFEQRGYQEIETPSMEFFDVYAANTGAVPQEELFKFFDEQGRILCLRYDGTVPVARMAATLLRDETPPLRFSYLGNMYRFREFGGGRQREFAQAGVELLGDQSPEADAEVIATAIASAIACGIKDMQVSIGQVGFFKALLDMWQISGQEADLLPRLINNKEIVALEEICERLDLPQPARQVIDRLVSSQDDPKILDELSQLLPSPEAQASLDNLRAVLTILTDYGYARYISIDLGMLQSLNYYTGIIFKGFTYGLGFPLFSGGRYDHLVSAFGRDLAATGFSIGINFIQTALLRHGQDELSGPLQIRLRYDRQVRPQAFQQAEIWRERGAAVICSPLTADEPADDLDPGLGQWLTAEMNADECISWRGQAPWNG